MKKTDLNKEEQNILKVFDRDELESALTLERAKEIKAYAENASQDKQLEGIELADIVSQRQDDSEVEIDIDDL